MQKANGVWTVSKQRDVHIALVHLFIRKCAQTSGFVTGMWNLQRHQPMDLLWYWNSGMCKFTSLDCSIDRTELLLNHCKYHWAEELVVLATHQLDLETLVRFSHISIARTSSHHEPISQLCPLLSVTMTRKKRTESAAEMRFIDLGIGYYQKNEEQWTPIKTKEACTPAKAPVAANARGDHMNNSRIITVSSKSSDATATCAKLLLVVVEVADHFLVGRVPSIRVGHHCGDL